MHTRDPGCKHLLRPMRYPTFILRSFAFVTCLLLMITAAAQAKERKAVTECFKRYQEAVLADKGADAADQVDSRTIVYYARMLELSRTADSMATDALPILDKLMVLIIRAETSAEQLAAMKDGRDIFIYAVEGGMVSKGSVMGFEMKDVEVKGDFAIGTPLKDGSKAPFGFHFYREGGTWRMDLTSIFEFASAGFQHMVDESGKSTNAYIMELLATMYGTTVPMTLWMPDK